MNRIILIGNGFDLAHGLPTAYAHFVHAYHAVCKSQLSQNSLGYEDELCSIKISDPEDQRTLKQLCWILNDSASPISHSPVMESCIDRLNQLYNSSLKYKSHLFAAINKNIKDRNWVDIENEYYLAQKNNKKIDTIYELEYGQKDYFQSLDSIQKDFKELQKAYPNLAIAYHHLQKII